MVSFFSKFRNRVKRRVGHVAHRKPVQGHGSESARSVPPFLVTGTTQGAASSAGINTEDANTGEENGLVIPPDPETNFMDENIDTQATGGAQSPQKTAEQLDIHDNSIRQLGNTPRPGQVRQRARTQPRIRPGSLYGLHPQVNPSQLEDELFQLIEDSKRGRKNAEIILPEDIKRIWKPVYYQSFYAYQPWYDHGWDKNCFMDDYLIIMSILIRIHFREWVKFRAIFIDEKNRRDCDLPFSLEHLQSMGLKTFSSTFYETQWMFCPMKIEEREKEYTMTPDEPRRLPFIEESEPIAEGAYGLVVREKIAANYLVYENRTVNPDPKCVAVKRVGDRNVQKIEFDNLKHLRRCLGGHKRIMVNIATIVHPEANNGPVHWIVYELAAYDLNVLLTTQPKALRNKRAETASPARTNSANMWPGDLILESRNLADALDYLHNRLYHTSKISLAHNDIKPENILVFYPDSTDEGDRYPVGKWKIADFGISKVKDKKLPGVQHLLAVDAVRLPRKPDLTHRIPRKTPSVSKTTRKRDPGRYTAPELDQEEITKEDGRKADVWSFGCVLSEILAYAVKLDCKLVEEFRVALEVNSADCRFYDVRTKEVKSSFSNFLDVEIQEAVGRDGKERDIRWVTECVNLAKKIVVKEPSDRPGADTIRDKLRDIDDLMRPEKAFWLGNDLRVDTTVLPGTESYSPGPENASATESPTEMDRMSLPISSTSVSPGRTSRVPSIVLSSSCQEQTGLENRRSSDPRRGKTVARQ